MEILPAMKGIPAKEVYQLVDVHMTDSIYHNKEINKVLADLYNLNTQAGKIFLVATPLLKCQELSAK